MSDIITNVQDYIHDMKEAVAEKGNDIVSEIETLVEEHEGYSDLFDDVFDARDCKDIAEAAGQYSLYSGGELEEALDELEQWQSLGDYDEVSEIVTNSDGGVRVADLTEELRLANEKLALANEQRLIALNVLDGIAKEKHNELTRLLQEDHIEQQRAAESGAYEAGLNDGILVRQDMGTTVPLDIIIAPEEDDNE
jgi:hypothetical protein